jgi:hypothetical protein
LGVTNRPSPTLHRNGPAGIDRVAAAVEQGAEVAGHWRIAKGRLATARAGEEVVVAETRIAEPHGEVDDCVHLGLHREARFSGRRAGGLRDREFSRSTERRRQAVEHPILRLHLGHTHADVAAELLDGAHGAAQPDHFGARRRILRKLAQAHAGGDVLSRPFNRAQVALQAVDRVAHDDLVGNAHGLGVRESGAGTTAHSAPRAHPHREVSAVTGRT